MKSVKTMDFDELRSELKNKRNHYLSNPNEQLKEEITAISCEIRYRCDDIGKSSNDNWYKSTSVHFNTNW